MTKEQSKKKSIILWRRHFLIDCHPAGSLFTKTALTNSDYVLIPVVPQRYAVRGIALMLKFINAKKRGTSPVPHILFNLTSRTGISEEEKEIRKNPRFSKKCLHSTLKKYKVFSDPLDGKGFAWESDNPGRRTFQNRKKEKGFCMGKR